MTVPALGSGFANPVFGSQATFRAILNAMARPGTVEAIPDSAEAPPPLNVGAAAFLLTLADGDTPVFIDAIAPNHMKSIAEWLGFQTGARLVDQPDDADFAVITDPGSIPSLSIFRQGTPEYPDRSATVVLQVAHFAGPRSLHLTGPGIQHSATLQPSPLPETLVAEFARNHRQFPLGVDVVFASDRALAALPRTTKIERGA